MGSESFQRTQEALRGLAAGLRPDLDAFSDYEKSVDYVAMVVARGLQRLWVAPDLCTNFSSAVDAITSDLDGIHSEGGGIVALVLAVRTGKPETIPLQDPAMSELTRIFAEGSPRLLNPTEAAAEFRRLAGRWLKAIATGLPIRVCGPIETSTTLLEQFERRTRDVAIGTQGNEPFMLSVLAYRSPQISGMHSPK